MDNYTKAYDFAATNWLSIATFLLGIAASWAISWWYFKQSSIGKRVWYSRHQSPIVRRVIEDFTLTYRGEAVANPHVIEFTVWNSGRQPILAADFPAGSSLQFSGDDVKFLSATITQISKKEARPTTTVNDDQSRVTLEFSYLDPGDGLCVEVVLDAKTASTRPDISLSGNLVGQTSGPRLRKVYRSKEQYLFGTIVRWTITIMGLVFIGTALHLAISGQNILATPAASPPDGSVAIWFSGIYGVVLLLMSSGFHRVKAPLFLTPSDEDYPATGSRSIGNKLAKLISIAIR